MLGKKLWSKQIGLENLALSCGSCWASTRSCVLAIWDMDKVQCLEWFLTVAGKDMLRMFRTSMQFLEMYRADSSENSSRYSDYISNGSEHGEWLPICCPHCYSWLQQHRPWYPHFPQSLQTPAQDSIAVVSFLKLPDIVNFPSICYVPGFPTKSSNGQDFPTVDARDLKFWRLVNKI